MKFSFNLKDASQVFVGAFALAVPISFSEEAWRLGKTLPFHNLIIMSKPPALPGDSQSLTNAGI